MNPADSSILPWFNDAYKDCPQAIEEKRDAMPYIDALRTLHRQCREMFSHHDALADVPRDLWVTREEASIIRTATQSIALGGSDSDIASITNAWIQQLGGGEKIMPVLCSSNKWEGTNKTLRQEVMSTPGVSASITPKELEHVAMDELDTLVARANVQNSYVPITFSFI